MEQIQLPDAPLHILPLLAAFAAVYPLAEFARMPSVESVSNRMGHVIGFGKAHQHVRPRDGLEHDPMRAARRKQRHDQKQLTGFDEGMWHWICVLV